MSQVSEQNTLFSSVAILIKLSCSVSLTHTHRASSSSHWTAQPPLRQLAQAEEGLHGQRGRHLRCGAHRRLVRQVSRVLLAYPVNGPPWNPFADDPWFNR
jgi:hypothetical protein